MIKEQTHIFAFFMQQLPVLEKKGIHEQAVLRDPSLLHRLITVLRLEPGRQFILFDQTRNLTCQITAVINKDYIYVTVIEDRLHQPLAPMIHWLLPLLERDAFREAVYALTAMGATSIQPLITKKIHRAWINPKEIERLQRIMISAAEQSKQFVLPTLMPVQDISCLPDSVTAQKSTARIFFDSTGSLSEQVIKQLWDSQPTSILCIVGPEGDLTHQEKDRVQSQNFIQCALTPTILRAETAVIVAMGMLRSLIRST